MYSRCRIVCVQSFDTGRSRGGDCAGQCLGQGESDGQSTSRYFLKTKLSSSVECLVWSQPAFLVSDQPRGFRCLYAVRRFHHGSQGYVCAIYNTADVSPCMTHDITRSLITNQLSKYGSHCKYEFVFWWHPVVHRSCTFLCCLRRLMSSWHNV